MSSDCILDFPFFSPTASFITLLFYLCLCRVGAIVQLQEELTGPSAQQRCVSSKMRKEFVRAGHLDPEKHMAHGSSVDISGYTYIIHCLNHNCFWFCNAVTSVKCGWQHDSMSD